MIHFRQISALFEKRQIAKCVLSFELSDVTVFWILRLLRNLVGLEDFSRINAHYPRRTIHPDLSNDQPKHSCLQCLTQMSFIVEDFEWHAFRGCSGFAATREHFCLSTNLEVKCSKHDWVDDLCPLLAAVASLPVWLVCWHASLSTSDYLADTCSGSSLLMVTLAVRSLRRALLLCSLDVVGLVCDVQPCTLRLFHSPPLASLSSCSWKSIWMI